MEGFLVILAIIGGIVGMLKDTKKAKQKPYQVPRPTATPSGGNYQRNQPVVERERTVERTFIDEQVDDRMLQMANGPYSNERHPHDALIGNTLGKPDNNELSKQKAEMKKLVKNNLSKKGLVDGIIMAEVLGPPRARKSYRNVVSERRK